MIPPGLCVWAACRSLLSQLARAMSGPMAPAGLPRGRAGNQTSSNLSMTSVSASPSRVHSWNAGSAIIVSM